MTGNVVHCLRYRDARGMIAWLERAFGFKAQLIVDDGEGGVAHAQLTLASGPHRGMIMLGSARGDAFGALQSPPDPSRPATASAYLVVERADPVYAMAKAAGAEIAIEIRDEDHGGRAFTCRDPEGGLWAVGDYDPWRGDG